MEPIPVSFHIGPLVLHTYGLGLGLTFWFAYWFMSRRFRSHGLGTRWLEKSFIPIIIAAVIGARIAHVVNKWHEYSGHPILVFAIWQGGLSSYGGIGGALIVVLWALHRHNPEIKFRQAFDVAVPVLLLSWGIGRLLGPQLMFAGGGHPTTAWYGMYYAGQVGKRIPAPIFQALEDFFLFGVMSLLEPIYLNGGMPIGTLGATGLGFWSIGRFFDQYLWLATPRVWDPVEVAALITLAVCIVVVVVSAIGFRHPSHTGNHPHDLTQVSTDSPN